MLMFLIWIPLMLIWVTSLVDIFMRQDLSGWAKALWVVAIFVVPWFGVLVYLIARPAEAPGAWATKSYEGEAYSTAPTPMGPPSTAQELERLGNLRSKGLLTEEEFAAAKASVLETGHPGTRAA